MSKLIISLIASLGLVVSFFFIGLIISNHMGPKIVYKVVEADSAAYWLDKPCEIKELADAGKKEGLNVRGGYATAPNEPTIKFCWVENGEIVWTWVEGAPFPIPFSKTDLLTAK
jgi:hypothetical protein